MFDVTGGESVERGLERVRLAEANRVFGDGAFVFVRERQPEERIVRRGIGGKLDGLFDRLLRARSGIESQLAALLFLPIEEKFPRAGNRREANEIVAVLDREFERLLAGLGI